MTREISEDSAVYRFNQTINARQVSEWCEQFARQMLRLAYIKARMSDSNSGKMVPATLSPAWAACYEEALICAVMVDDWHRCHDGGSSNLRAQLTDFIKTIRQS